MFDIILLNAIQVAKYDTAQLATIYILATTKFVDRIPLVLIILEKMNM